MFVFDRAACAGLVFWVCLAQPVLAKDLTIGAQAAGTVRWELDTIAAVVIGGVSLFGGSGSLPRAMLGVLIYLMLTNIMNLVNVDTYLQNVLKGVLIFVAVAMFTIAEYRGKLRRATL